MEVTDDNKAFTKNVIEVAIKIVILGAVIIWSFQVIQPFLIPIIWGIILAVAMEPLIARVVKILGGRRTLISVFFVFVILAAIVIPAVFLVTSSIETVEDLTAKIHQGTLVIPPPPAKIADWPLVGEPLHQIWQLAATNLEGALKQFFPQIKTAAGILLGSVGGGLAGFAMVIISTCIAGFFLAKAEKSSAAARRIIIRLAGENGAEITDLATATIRGVMQGVVGVALIQAVLAAVGMIVAGVPAAGLWAALVLIVAVVQLPAILVLGPVAAYVFSVSETTPAVIFLVWAIIVSGCDSILKPLLMGRGIDIPMLVILIGALGGMMLSGIIGLFAGAVILAIMYTLFMEWMDENDEEKIEK